MHHNVLLLCLYQNNDYNKYFTLMLFFVNAQKGFAIKKRKNVDGIKKEKYVKNQ